MITLQSFGTNLSVFYFYLPIYLSNQIFKSRHFVVEYLVRLTDKVAIVTH